MSFKFTTVCFIAALCLMAGFATAQVDPLGKPDTVSLFIAPVAEGKWVISAHVWNDEELAALDIPLKYTAGMAKVMVDSVSFKGTRTEYFAQKNYQVDTAKQIMHFGGFAYMDPQKPPLAVGKGEVARIYFSIQSDKKPGPFAADTTTYTNGSTMMLVDKNAKTIVPMLKIEYKKDSPAEGTKK